MAHFSQHAPGLHKHASQGTRVCYTGPMSTSPPPLWGARAKGDAMSRTKRQLVLNAFFMRFGHHPAAWRHPSSTGSGRPDPQYWVRLAQLTERAKFDAFFLADFIGRSGDSLDETSRRGGSF